MPRHGKVKGAAISEYLLLLLSIALNVIALSFLIMFVLSVAAMLAGRSSRLKVLKRSLVKEG